MSPLVPAIASASLRSAAACWGVRETTRASSSWIACAPATGYILAGLIVEAVLAFQKVARIIRESSIDFRKCMEEGKLCDIEGIGKGSQQIIEEYISDGMTEELIAQLGGMDPARLGVIARRSAMQFKKTAKRADHIGVDLGASHLLEGSLRRTGNHVRVAVQLIEAASQSMRHKGETVYLPSTVAP